MTYFHAAHAGKSLAEEIAAGHIFLLDYKIINAGGFDHMYEYIPDELQQKILDEDRDIRHMPVRSSTFGQDIDLAW